MIKFIKTTNIYNEKIILNIESISEFYFNSEDRCLEVKMNNGTVYHLKHTEHAFLEGLRSATKSKETLWVAINEIL